jgi:3-oxoadipate enol-lactonase/4-carboxymuconolactone decarboxylase
LPFTKVGDSRLFYRLEGIAGRPVLVLSHSIGTDHAMWNLQIPDLLSYFQVLRYDTRGHGASDAPKAHYSIAQLGEDVISLADSLGIAKFAFCGLSMGGGIGLWIAANAPNRLTSLILANTSPTFGDPGKWESRISAVTHGGMAAIADMAMQRFFSHEILAKSPEAASVRSVLLATNPEGYIGCCAALRDLDLVQALPSIATPTLIIVGDHDISTPWAGHGEVLAQEIKGSEVVYLPAAHLSNIECPRSFTNALMEFLRPESAFPSDPLAAGCAMRRSVLGEAHVNAAVANTTEFTREFQEIITRYAWGTIWTRPGMNPRTRRLLALSILAAVGRWEEFTMHIRTGLEHELELCDVKEVLLQTAVYAGVPAANTGFHIVSECMKNVSMKDER